MSILATQILRTLMGNHQPDVLSAWAIEKQVDGTDFSL